MWGFEPAESAIVAADIFIENGINDILIPGIGYGRNAEIFFKNGLKVAGIEISETAINLAKTHFGDTLKIYHGSVTDMPFDNHVYAGIFCYGLLYLLDSEEREKFLKDCWQQLEPGGIMIFSVISKNSPNYGLGKNVGKDRFELFEGAKIFFYGEESVRQEFGEYGITNITEIDEPVKNMPNKPPFKFLLVICRR